MNVTPVIQSVPDWKALNQICGNLSGRLDELGISLKDPEALPAGMQPLHGWCHHSCQRLITLTFLIEHEGVITEFLALGQFSVLSFPPRVMRSNLERDFITGTLDQWILAINAGCTPKVDWFTRSLCNELYLLFRKSAAAKIWADKELVSNNDGTDVWRQ